MSSYVPGDELLGETAERLYNDPYWVYNFGGSYSNDSTAASIRLGKTLANDFFKKVTSHYSVAGAIRSILFNIFTTLSTVPPITSQASKTMKDGYRALFDAESKSAVSYLDSIQFNSEEGLIGAMSSENGKPGLTSASTIVKDYYQDLYVSVAPIAKSYMCIPEIVVDVLLDDFLVLASTTVFKYEYGSFKLDVQQNILPRISLGFEAVFGRPLGKYRTILQRDLETNRFSGRSKRKSSRRNR